MLKIDLLRLTVTAQHPTTATLSIRLKKSRSETARRDQSRGGVYMRECVSLSEGNIQLRHLFFPRSRQVVSLQDAAVPSAALQGGR